jgi:hypothetical protein
LPADNGERFLSDYLKEQLERYRLYGEHELNDLCQCPRCLGARTAQGAASPMAADETMEPSGQDEVAEVDIDGDDDVISTASNGDELVDGWDDEEKGGDTEPALGLCNIAPKPPMPSQPYQLPPHLQQPLMFGTQLPNVAPSSYSPFGYPTAAVSPHPPFPLAAAAMMQPPYYNPLGSCPPAPTAPLATRSKPQVDYCCYPFFHYYTMIKPVKGRKAGRPPHSPDCPKAQEETEKRKKKRKSVLI